MRSVVLPDIARALLHCHARGVIHGDVRPHSIIIVRGGAGRRGRRSGSTNSAGTGNAVAFCSSETHSAASRSPSSAAPTGKMSWGRNSGPEAEVAAHSVCCARDAVAGRCAGHDRAVLIDFGLAVVHGEGGLRSETDSESTEGEEAEDMTGSDLLHDRKTLATATDTVTVTDEMFGSGSLLSPASRIFARDFEGLASVYLACLRPEEAPDHCVRMPFAPPDRDVACGFAGSAAAATRSDASAAAAAAAAAVDPFLAAVKATARAAAGQAFCSGPSAVQRARKSA